MAVPPRSTPATIFTLDIPVQTKNARNASLAGGEAFASPLHFALNGDYSGKLFKK